MIVENTSKFELRERWNRHLGQNILEARINGEWCALGAIRLGEQFFDNGIKSVTTLPRQNQRFDCDLQFASTVLSSEDV